MGYKFFTNTACEYYPCHDIGELNCLFCYCPLYTVICSGGSPKYKNGIRDCSTCTFPHKAENYDAVLRILSNHHSFDEKIHAKNELAMLKRKLATMPEAAKLTRGAVKSRATVLQLLVDGYLD